MVTRMPAQEWHPWPVVFILGGVLAAFAITAVVAILQRKDDDDH